MIGTLSGAKEKLTSDEIQTLGMLAQAHGYTDLYIKCCRMMYQNMRRVPTQENIYNSLFRTYEKGALARGATPEQARRIANIGAVKNTAEEWRKRYDV